MGSSGRLGPHAKTIMGEFDILPTTTFPSGAARVDRAPELPTHRPDRGGWAVGVNTMAIPNGMIRCNVPNSRKIRLPSMTRKSRSSILIRLTSKAWPTMMCRLWGMTTTPSLAFPACPVFLM